MRRGRARSTHDDVVGGATLTFDVCPGHPYMEQATGLLRRVRAEVNELWDEVQRYNEDHPIPEDDMTRVSFYFGQSVASPDEE